MGLSSAFAIDPSTMSHSRDSSTEDQSRPSLDPVKRIISEEMAIRLLTEVYVRSSMNQLKNFRSLEKLVTNWLTYLGFKILISFGFRDCTQLSWLVESCFWPRMRRKKGRKKLMSCLDCIWSGSIYSKSGTRLRSDNTLQNRFGLTSKPVFWALSIAKYVTRFNLNA